VPSRDDMAIARWELVAAGAMAVGVGWATHRATSAGLFDSIKLTTLVGSRFAGFGPSFAAEVIVKGRRSGCSRRVREAEQQEGTNGPDGPDQEPTEEQCAETARRGRAVLTVANGVAAGAVFVASTIVARRARAALDRLG
jgi:hypothetical protein